MGMWGHGIMDGDPAMDVVGQIADYCDIEGCTFETFPTEVLLPHLNKIERDLIRENPYTDEILPTVYILLESGLVITPDLDRFINPVIEWELDCLGSWEDPDARRRAIVDLQNRIGRSRER